MATEFCPDTDDSKVVNGAYRELNEFLLKLAEMYIEVDKALGAKSFFNHFGSDIYNFRLAIGADGAPLGKDDEATAWLVSSLNVGNHIASQDENLLQVPTAVSHTCACKDMPRNWFMI